MDTAGLRPPLSTSPVATISRGAYFDVDRPKLSRKNRVNTPLRSVSLTDFTGPWAPQYVLSLDGGGIKGYSSLLILERLMKHIQEVEARLGADEFQTWYTEDTQPQPPFEPCYYFDYIFGTSTGGLIAIMLGRLRMSVDESLQAYKDLAGKVFANPRWFSVYGLARDMYDHHELKKAIDAVVEKQRSKQRQPVPKSDPEEPEVGKVQELQSDEPRVDGVQKSFGGALNSGPTFNSDPAMCRTVCVAYAAIEDTKENPFLFRSYEHIENNRSWPFDSGSLHSAAMSDNADGDSWWVLQRNPGPAHALPIWQVARATTAATGFFKPMTIEDIDFVDGALGCNNPTWEAWNEVVQMHNGNRDAVRMLLSIGTGQSEVTRIGRGRVGRIFQAVKAAVGFFTGTEETHNKMNDISKDHPNLTYERFSAPKSSGVGQLPMDFWDDNVRQQIEDRTKEYLDQPVSKQKLVSVAEKLVIARRERAATRRWPISTSQVRYRCIIKNCNNGQKVRNTFDELWSHIATEHFPKNRPLPPRAIASQRERDAIEEIIKLGQIVH